jgi:hypothetical protein
LRTHIADGASSNNTISYYMVIDGAERPIKYDYRTTGVNINTQTPFKVKCMLGRGSEEFSPGISSIRANTHCHYIENISPALTSYQSFVSSVEDKKDIINLVAIGFHIPSYATRPKYSIKYSSETTLPYILYFKSTTGISRRYRYIPRPC